MHSFLAADFFCITGDYPQAMQGPSGAQWRRKDRKEQQYDSSSFALCWGFMVSDRDGDYAVMF